MRKPASSPKHKSEITTRVILLLCFNRPEVHRLGLPAGGGIASARDMAKVYAMLASGGVWAGARYLQPATLQRAITPTNNKGDIDRSLRIPIIYGLGWMLGHLARGATLRTFGHPGKGGQVCLADLDRELSFAFLAVQRAGQNSDYHLWLGRAYGEKARRASVLQQPVLAIKVKEYFEKAVALNPDNLAARSDLREYYLEAPIILGGSQEKAREQAEEIRKREAQHTRP